MSHKRDIATVIRKVWEKILCKKNITDQDNFGDLGGDASKLIDIVYHLEIELQIELPVEVLLMTVTVKEMAFAIDFLNKDTQIQSQYLNTKQLLKLKMNQATLGDLVQDDSLIVKINKAGTLPPIFWCFNCFGVESLSLSKKLLKSQPLYALISSLTLGKSQTILENLASHYVDEILRLFPDGPFYLGGNCRGAKVMCEVVFQLQKRGKQVDKLCLLEFFHPNLYDFPNKLMLLFGEKSEYQRHKLLNWGEERWESSFSSVPEVHFIPCGHGQFFRDKNIGDFAKIVNQFFS